MDELIKIDYTKEAPTVSARDLYGALGIEKRFSAWFKINSQDFIQNEDYSNPYLKVRVQKEGNRTISREVDDYDLSVDMAKHICLMSRTPKGKECRQQLIELEKAWNTPEQVMARALKIAEQSIKKLRSENITLSKENNLLAEKHLEWDGRSFINAAGRKYAGCVCSGSFSNAWTAFKKELLYKHSINLNSRMTNYLNSTGKKTKPKTLNLLDDSEIPSAVSTIVSLCRESEVDISELINNLCPFDKGGLIEQR